LQLVPITAPKLNSLLYCACRHKDLHLPIYIAISVASVMMPWLLHKRFLSRPNAALACLSLAMI